MSTATSHQQSIEEMVRRIATAFSPDKIILFGSHARGDVRAGSDVDLLVLFSSVESPRERAAIRT
jgi:predicted nucleotidyltransferase